ncbi:DUF2510 domain-containing protein [Gordonia sp. X0973]|uniref:DUF2510 domain-containing protein n=1 Tax=Gordonia sp. X0973 TaxID=2742602 RepID=UPI000F538252|nr:DUF2510 domain-containing protein [Gordonia sp. X0973]QKT07017.1 DUF2510 domain-containing protein [Gordonia sp. X0973]
MTKTAAAGWYSSRSGEPGWYSWWDGHAWTGDRRQGWSEQERTRAMAAAVQREIARGAKVRWINPYLVEVDHRPDGARRKETILRWLPGLGNLWGWLLIQSVRSNARFMLFINEVGEIGRSS